MSNICPVGYSSVNYVKNLKAPKLSCDTPSQTLAAPSFRAAAPKKVSKNVFAAALAAITGLFASKSISQKGWNDKVTEEAETIDKPFLEEQQKLKEQCEQRDAHYWLHAVSINERLANSLLLKTHQIEVDRDRYASRRVYNEYMILKIVQANEISPKYAIELAQALDHEEGCGELSPEKVDYAIEKIRNDSKNYEKFKAKTLDNTVKLLEMNDKNPELMEKIYNRNMQEGHEKGNIASLGYMFEHFPESVDKLLDSDVNYSLISINHYAPRYMKNIDVFDDVYKLTGRAYQELCDEYRKDPKKFEEIVQKYGYLDTDYMEFVKNSDNKNLKEYFDDVRAVIYNININEKHRNEILKHLKDVIKYEPVLKPITDTIEKPSERYEMRKKIISTFSYSLKEVMPRMVKDGIIAKDYDELKQLVELYRRYPDISITDRMVKLNKDPSVRDFDISKL